MPVQQTGSIEIVVNGAARSVPEGKTLLEILALLQIDPSRVAVELDLRIIKKDQWSDTLVRAGAQLEVVQFVGGG